MFQSILDWLDLGWVRFLYMLLKDLWSLYQRYVAKRKADQKRKDEQSTNSDDQS
ncbi:MAG: hypothetical protein Salg2KO_21050 [Salibacteraceae bacterium]